MGHLSSKMQPSKASGTLPVWQPRLISGLSQPETAWGTSHSNARQPDTVSTCAAKSPDSHRTPTQPARRRRNNSTLILLPGIFKYRQNVLPRKVWEICYMRPRLPLGLASWYETGGSLT